MADTDKAVTRESYLFVAFFAIAMVVFCVQTFLKSERQLTDLQKTTGPLQTAEIKRVTGKNNYSFLEFSLVGNPEKFVIGDSNSNEPLTDLLSYLQIGKEITVYHDGQVYQVEITLAGGPPAVIYPIEEVRNQARGYFALSVIGTFIFLAVALSQYLQHRASSEAESS